MRKAFIKAVDYYLPEKILSNDQLAQEFPEFPAEKIFKKTGIKERHISAENEFVTEMAIKAAGQLFKQKIISPDQIDFLLFCTQTPDQLLPNCSCIIQEKLGLSQKVGALDFNLGCSGYVYGISLAKALIESYQAENILLLTADTYSKLIEPNDKTVKTIFGDAATATLVSCVASKENYISVCAYGTNGQGAGNLCVSSFGLRGQYEKNSDSFLRMLGPKIFEFALDVVPSIVVEALEKAHLTFDDIDFFVFHQANQFMLEHLRKKLNIPKEKFVIEMDFCGNTVSSTIPIALSVSLKKQKIKAKNKMLLVGFGIGYSWGAIVVEMVL